MKTYTILIIAMLCFGTIQAQQKIEKHLSFSGKTDVELNIQIADSIFVQTWNKNEVYAEASVNINDNADNEAYVTSFEENGDGVKVNARFKENYFKGRNDCCNKSDIWWKVFIPENTNVTIETINADLTIKGETGRMNLKSISGFIDMAVPEKRSANLDFSSISGTIYSDLRLTPENNGSGVPVKIKDKMNNGGSEIKLETISGDIFFRKSD
jgi:predicted membrane protein